MLKVYYCPKCDETTYLQYDTNTDCRVCNAEMFKLDISFVDYTDLSIQKRKDYIASEFGKN
ncbi:MAG: hypothetical protein IJV15_10330 [Lachnospiraceae bacterium]|nr:hypothetical protein [Lachnospiraceae bacterium]